MNYRIREEKLYRGSYFYPEYSNDNINWMSYKKRKKGYLMIECYSKLDKAIAFFKKCKNGYDDSEVEEVIIHNI